MRRLLWQTHSVVVPGNTACRVGLRTSHCANEVVYAYGDVEHCTLSPTICPLLDEPRAALTAAWQAASVWQRLQSSPVKPDEHWLVELHPEGPAVFCIAVLLAAAVTELLHSIELQVAPLYAGCISMPQLRLEIN